MASTVLPRVSRSFWQRVKDWYFYPTTQSSREGQGGTWYFVARPWAGTQYWTQAPDDFEKAYVIETEQY